MRTSRSRDEETPCKHLEASLGGALNAPHVHAVGFASRRHPLPRAWSSGSTAAPSNSARTAPMRTSLRPVREDLFALTTIARTLASLDCGKEDASASEKSGSASRRRAAPRPRAPSRAAPTVAAAQTASVRAPTTRSNPAHCSLLPCGRECVLLHISDTGTVFVMPMTLHDRV